MYETSAAKTDSVPLIPVEWGAETVRLVHLDQMLTQAMGGLLPDLPAEQSEGIGSLLDLACGPGSWTLDVAQAYYPRLVTGVDASREMVQYARAMAQVRGLDNADFQVMTLTNPLDFPDETFDLVTGRLLSRTLGQAHWPALLKECWRVLKPGGIMRLTECEMGLSSSPALHHLQTLLTRALWQQGRTCSVDGRSMGMVHRLGKLLLEAGFEQLHYRPFVLDSSVYTSWHYRLVKEAEITFSLLKPMLLSAEVIDEVLFENTLQQMLFEMLNEDFTCLAFGLTAWAIKPACLQSWIHETGKMAFPRFAFIDSKNHAIVDNPA